MMRSPDSLIPSRERQVAVEKRDDKALTCRQEGEANSRALPRVGSSLPCFRISSCMRWIVSGVLTMAIPAGQFSWFVTRMT